MVAVDWEGFRVDAAARFVAASDRFLLALAREVGLEDKLVRSRPPRPEAMGERRKEDMLSAPTLCPKLLTPTAREPIVVRKALAGAFTVEQSVRHRRRVCGRDTQKRVSQDTSDNWDDHEVMPKDRSIPGAGETAR